MKTVKQLLFMAFIAIFLSSIMGCASNVSKKYIDEKIQQLERKDKETEAQVNAVRSEMIEDFGEVWQEMETSQKTIATLKEEIDTTVSEAINRTLQAHGTASGKLLYEVTISDASIPFAYNRSELSKEAKAALDTFSGMLIAENEVVYIEIQGHTDDIGSKRFNLKLGQERSESARRYLHLKHGIPLNRLSTFSYGESKPVASNNKESNRAENRRVVLLVME